MIQKCVTKYCHRTGQLESSLTTGIEKMAPALSRIFVDDDERTYFLAILPAHPEMKGRGEVGGEVEIKSLNDTEKAILNLLKKRARSAEELADELGLKSRSGSFTRTLRGLMDNGFINYLYPETPRHPRQKYVLLRENMRK